MSPSGCNRKRAERHRRVHSVRIDESRSSRATGVGVPRHVACFAERLVVGEKERLGVF